MSDYEHLPEVSNLGRRGSEFRLVIDQLATTTATVVWSALTCPTTLAVEWNDRRVLLTFNPDEAGGLTIQVRAFRDDDWTEITMDELGDVWLLHV